jgi:orotidine-5'-phosphate decarboxylase
MEINMTDPKVIVALDYDNESDALNFVSRINPKSCRLKVGNEMFTTAGPQFVEKLINKDFEVFLDLKFHDIPNTVARACEAAARLGVWMVNVHASGGAIMMQTAADAVAKFEKKPLLIGVTVLTSMDRSQLGGIGLDLEPIDQVLRLAKLAKDSGLDGVVSSARETAAIKEQIASPFVCVTPGIRSEGSDIGDQKRIMTPVKALEAGADYLVIGRPITKAVDPQQALEQINASIAHLS